MADEVDLGIDGLEDVVMIGRGGFSSVYSARHTLVRRPIAVKVLNRLDAEADRRRFERECEVMGRMSDHPNVVSIHHAGYADNGHPYLLMELVADGTLADLLDRHGPLGWERAADYVAQVCDALSLAHAEEILHRDIKPENILLDGETPKLTDFGIAYLRDATGATSTHITASWLHTPPETFDNKRDERSDIYSLGSTLYALISGNPPFWRGDEESLNPLLMRLVTESAPLLDPSLAPPELVALIGQTLARDPEARPQTATELAAALRGIGTPGAPGMPDLASAPSGPPPSATQVAPEPRTAPETTAAPDATDPLMDAAATIAAPEPPTPTAPTPTAPTPTAPNATAPNAMQPPLTPPLPATAAAAWPAPGGAGADSVATPPPPQASPLQASPPDRARTVPSPLEQAAMASALAVVVTVASGLTLVLGQNPISPFGVGIMIFLIGGLIGRTIADRSNEPGVALVVIGIGLLGVAARYVVVWRGQAMDPLVVLSTLLVGIVGGFMVQRWWYLVRSRSSSGDLFGSAAPIGIAAVAAVLGGFLFFDIRSAASEVTRTAPGETVLIMFLVLALVLSAVALAAPAAGPPATVADEPELRISAIGVAYLAVATVLLVAATIFGDIFRFFEVGGSPLTNRAVLMLVVAIPLALFRGRSPAPVLQLAIGIGAPVLGAVLLWQAGRNAWLFTYVTVGLFCLSWAVAVSSVSGGRDRSSSGGYSTSAAVGAMFGAGMVAALVAGYAVNQWFVYSWGVRVAAFLLAGASAFLAVASRRTDSPTPTG